MAGHLSGANPSTIGNNSLEQPSSAADGDKNEPAAGEQIELTPLNEGQSLHLNLAAGRLKPKQTISGAYRDAPMMTKKEVQLQFVCQVGGSRPRARVEWTRTGSGSAPTERLNEDRKSMDKLTSLLERGKQEDQLNYPTLQWSSIRLHNISVEDHGIVIRCAAINEKFQDGGQPSMSVSLNITHLPLVKLELDDAHEANGTTAMVNKKLTTGPEDDRGSLDEDIRAIGSTNNVSLLCSVTFSNPPLGPQSIEWLLNDSVIDGHQMAANGNAALNASGRFGVHLLDRSALANGAAERLKLCFTDNDDDDGQDLNSIGKPSEMIIKCRARNALGLGESQAVRLLVGAEPHCYGSETGMLASNAAPSSVQCPVISDRNSSSFHWSLSYSSKAKRVLVSESAAIPVGKLNVTGDVDQLNGLSCFATDKFGSNEARPCIIDANQLIRLVKLSRGDSNLEPAIGAKGELICQISMISRARVSK